jgi:hypothetical protein
LVVAVGLVFFRQLQAVCFDEEFARLRGLNVEFYYLLLLCLAALTVVLLITVVGIILVIALLTLPVAIAGYFSKRLWQMMVLSIIICGLFTSGGLAISYSPDLPSGAIMKDSDDLAHKLLRLLGITRKRAGKGPDTGKQAGDEELIVTEGTEAEESKTARPRSELLAMYGFSANYPDNARLELNPKTRREKGDIVLLQRP